MGFIGENFGCKGIALVAVLRIGCRVQGGSGETCQEGYLK